MHQLKEIKFCTVWKTKEEWGFKTFIEEAERINWAS